MEVAAQHVLHMSMRHMDPHGVLKYTGRIEENRWEEEEEDGDFVLPLQHHHPAVMCLIRNKNQRAEWDLRATLLRSTRPLFIICLSLKGICF